MRRALVPRRRSPPPASRHEPALCPAAADKLGTGFMIVKHDVGGNIDRLATCAATKPDVYQADVFAMVRLAAWLRARIPGCKCLLRRVSCSAVQPAVRAQF